MNCPSSLSVLCTCNSSCNLSWRSSTTAALHQTIYPWHLAWFTRAFRGRNLNNFLGKSLNPQNLVWTEFPISVFRSQYRAGRWCWPCSSRAVLLCAFPGMGFKDGQAVPEVFFPSLPRPSVGAVIGTSSGAWERRRGRNCPGRQRLQSCAQLCTPGGRNKAKLVPFFSWKSSHKWVLFFRSVVNVF